MGNVSTVLEDLLEPDEPISPSAERPTNTQNSASSCDASRSASNLGPHHKRWQTDRCYLPNELERRRRAIEELLSSERTFVRDLGVLIDTFILPLSAYADECEVRSVEDEGSTGSERSSNFSEVTRAELLTVFSNVEQLAAFNKQLLLELDAAQEQGGAKAMLDCFLKAAPFFKMYGIYVANFEKSREMLNELVGRPSIAVFIKACELQRACHGLQLADFLIMPVQRIPRYKLLLETMLKHTKDRDPLHHRLSENLAQMSVIAETINADIHKAERRNKVLSLQYQFSEDWVSASRLFVKEGPLIKVCRNGPRKFQFVLFNNLLVYGSEKLMGKWGRQQYRMNRAIDLGRCFVVDGLCGGSLVPVTLEAHSFMVVSPDKSFVVQAADPVEKAEWVAALRGAMSVLLTARAKLPSSLRISSAKLRLSGFGKQKGHKSKQHRNGGSSGGGLGTAAAHHGGAHANGAAAGAGGSSSGGANGAAHYHGSGYTAGSGSSGSGSGSGNFADAAAAGKGSDEKDDGVRQRRCAVWALGAEGRVTRAGFRLPRAASVHVTFKDLMQNPRQRGIFRQHLQATHCSENLDFWEAAAQFQKGAAAGNGGAVAAARAIADKYVREGASHQVNLGADMRNAVLAACKAGRCPDTLFVAGAQEVSQILERDSFLRFRATDGFAELLAMLEPDPEPCGVLRFEELSPDPAAAGAPWLRSPPSLSPTSTSPAASRGGFTAYHISTGAQHSTSTGNGTDSGNHCGPPPLHPCSPIMMLSPAHRSPNCLTSSSSDGGHSVGNCGSSSCASDSPCSQQRGSQPHYTAPPPSRRGSRSSKKQLQAAAAAPLSPTITAAALAAIPAPGEPAETWAMGQHGVPVPPAGLAPGPHRVLVVMKPGPEGFGMNLELNEEGRALVRGFRQLGVGLLNPAQEAGIVLGDVLLECNGYLTDTFTVVVDALKHHTGTEPVRLVVRRELDASSCTVAAGSSSSTMQQPASTTPNSGVSSDAGGARRTSGQSLHFGWRR